MYAIIYFIFGWQSSILIYSVAVVGQMLVQACRNEFSDFYHVSEAIISDYQHVMRNIITEDRPKPTTRKHSINQLNI